MLASTLAYGGLMVVLAGLLALCTRRRWGWTAVIGGASIILVGLYLPPPSIRRSAADSRLDELIPTYQYRERHTIHVNTGCAASYRAVKQLRASEVRLFRTLTWIRRFGRSGRESLLNPSDSIPLLEVATRTGFLPLADEPGREIVIGVVLIHPSPGDRVKTAEEFAALNRPGLAKAAMNFSLQSDGPAGCRVSTETRIVTTDDRSRRAFGVYWRVIYPGSAVIRRMWLRAVKRRAEGRVRL